MSIFSRLLGFLYSHASKTGNTAIPIENSGYKLYVQYEDSSKLKKGSKVKMNEITVGKVIATEQNPDAFIVTLLIDVGIKIPLLSKFKIISALDQIYHINIECSTDNRLIRPNEYFNGTE